MAVLAKVSTLSELLPGVLVDPCLYYCCTTRTTVEDHGYAGQVKHATQTTTKHFSRFDRHAWAYAIT